MRKNVFDHWRPHSKQVRFFQISVVEPKDK
jgi:hypothetical protein